MHCGCTCAICFADFSSRWVTTLQRRAQHPQCSKHLERCPSCWQASKKCPHIQVKWSQVMPSQEVESSQVESSQVKSTQVKSSQRPRPYTRGQCKGGGGKEKYIYICIYIYIYIHTKNCTTTGVSQRTWKQYLTWNRNPGNTEVENPIAPI